MVKEAYVSFETAKLLKEKGFDEVCIGFYTPEKELHLTLLGESNSIWKDASISAPTQQMAMRWLREECLMDCFVGAKAFEPQSGKLSGYSANVWYKSKNNQGICCYWVYPPQDKECWESYEDAAEAAIQYCLTKLL